ncbi:hypothetical protein [Parachitinimonas caeni]|uniref:Secreted protein n=1 Tax=Parachitinimonas caeni TaxID=3031301 RepID=A0ABT7DWG4_9NEIS|nr:hypothetical protein [Parachitinimonas caeni]MDK2124402.1 hypothetical protein [Parachitinimonas caeni]
MIRAASRRFGLLLLLVSLAAPALVSAPALASNDTAGGGSITETGDPLQSALRRKRPRGPIFIAIGSVLLFGVPHATGAPQYCSPQFRVVNFSNTAIREIAFTTNFTGQGSDKIVGSTVTNFNGVPVRGSVFRYFYQLDTANCSGLKGEVEILYCKYSNGDDCSGDIHPVHGGGVPLKRKTG